MVSSVLGLVFTALLFNLLNYLTVDGILQAGGFPNAMLTITPLQHILLVVSYLVLFLWLLSLSLHLILTQEDGFTAF